ncbi:MAG: hypothetical protein DMG26_15775 [Acidobacteria bacterium]|nr:MAG: hypothetical protein DMG26_15775 [Acidobacteriota bacterium]
MLRYPPLSAIRRFARAKADSGYKQAAAPNVGDKAPDFSLPDQNGKQVKLSDFVGKKNVVLAFYVLAFTGG